MATSIMREEYVIPICIEEWVRKYLSEMVTFIFIEKFVADVKFISRDFSDDSKPSEQGES